MATERQRAALKKLVENGGKSVSRAMREAKLPNGEKAYSDKTAINPNKLTESKGFKELCDECGLTDDLIINSLVEDIKLKPQNRIGELGLASKIKGIAIDRIDHTTKGEKITQDISDEQYESILRSIAKDSGITKSI